MLSSALTKNLWSYIMTGSSERILNHLQTRNCWWQIWHDLIIHAWLNMVFSSKIHLILVKNQNSYNLFIISNTHSWSYESWISSLKNDFQRAANCCVFNGNNRANKCYIQLENRVFTKKNFHRKKSIFKLNLKCQIRCH